MVRRSSKPSILLNKKNTSWLDAWLNAKLTASQHITLAAYHWHARNEKTASRYRIEKKISIQ